MSAYKIAAIFAKHLSDALLSIHAELLKQSEITKLGNEKVSIVQQPSRLKYAYSARDKVLVNHPASNLPIKMRVLKRISDQEYLCYHQGGRRSDAIKIPHDWIIGLDPDR